MHIKLPMALMGCLLVLTGAALASAPITLVANGKPAATIVVADQPTAIPLGKRDPETKKSVPMTQRDVAEELQALIEKASGARLEIVPAAQAPRKGTLLLVGRSALSKQHQLALPTKPEGLRIATFARGVAILGEVAPAGTANIPHELDRGTLHGVHEFLERIVGYRFFIHIANDPDFGIVTPVVKTLTVPADYQLELAPDFPFRAVAFPNYHPQRDWMRVTREGAGTGFRGINHSDSGFRRYFKDHPDWAALRADGTRDPVYPCYSHPGVLAARVQATQEFYDGKTPWFGAHSKPGPKWIPFEPTDIWDLKGLCWCERCERQYQPERGRFGKQSNLVFRHGVEYAAEIAKRWPDKRLCLLVARAEPATDAGLEQESGRQARAAVRLELFLLAGVLDGSAALLPTQSAEMAPGHPCHLQRRIHLSRRESAAVRNRHGLALAPSDVGPQRRCGRAHP